jgi:hypothetical protein
MNQRTSQSMGSMEGNEDKPPSQGLEASEEDKPPSISTHSYPTKDSDGIGTIRSVRVLSRISFLLNSQNSQTLISLFLYTRSLLTKPHIRFLPVTNPFLGLKAGWGILYHPSKRIASSI